MRIKHQDGGDTDKSRYCTIPNNCRSGAGRNWYIKSTTSAESSSKDAMTLLNIATLLSL